MATGRFSADLDAPDTKFSIWGSGRYTFQSYGSIASSSSSASTSVPGIGRALFFNELLLSRGESSFREPAAEEGLDEEFGRDDEEAQLKWAALERLPTYNRLRTSILEQRLGSRVVREQLDVTKLGLLQQQQIIDQVLKANAEEDNERFLRKLRNRIDKVGIRVPTIEIRYQNVTVDANCFVGNRALPTLKNVTINFLEGVLGKLGLLPTRKTEMNILHNVSGILKPARMTLLLGPPGSGKTTLLLALAAKLDPDLKVGGTVTYNGHTLDEFVPQRTSSYISQQDLHVPDMTVRETLDFSARCQGVGTRYEMLAELAKREKEAGIFPESDVDVYMKATAVEGMKSSISTKYIMKILGLDVCADTIVGDSMRRGVSGGQKKRVTTGEIIVGPPKALMMDEISTGLDSSTTHRIVKCLSQFCHILEDTIMVSLLQPDPETFNLFDDVVLLSEGHIVYHGPRDHVLEFFEACGFECPDRKGIADFLQEVTSRKDQGQYWSSKMRPYRYVSVEEFAQRFTQFHVGIHLAEELRVPYDRELSHNAALTFNRYGVRPLELFKANFSRELLLMKRQSFVHVFKAFQVAILALITMTTFFRTTMEHKTEADGSVYAGALVFGVMVMLFNSYSEVSMTIFRLPVFFKQRDLLFFPAWTYALPSMVVSIPSAIVEAGIYSIITYYSIGFAPEPSRFFKYYLVLIAVNVMSSSMFRMIAGTCRTMVVANTGGSFTLMAVVLLAGFIIPRTEIHPWWIWGYWASPLAYGVRAISVNEFLAPRWSTLNHHPGVHDHSHLTLGMKVLQSFGIQHEAYWYWIGVAALVGFTVLFNFMFTLSLTYLNPLGKPQAVISEAALAEKNKTRRGDHEIVVSTRRRNTNANNLRSLRSQNPYENDGEFRKFHEHVMQVSNEASLLYSEPTLAREWSENLIATRRGMIMPFKPLALSFNDIKYFVPTPPEMRAQGVTMEPRLQLLCSVTGAFRPGVLTALVGASGAGKTTFMDVLAGRKTGGEIEGEIRVAGFPKRQETFARVAGYCEQLDVHSPQVTVRESLIFSAWLRLPSDIPHARMQFVEEVMELVELKDLEHALVGLPGVSGLSTEQRKRLTIAVELVANPSIIFMDEPTSGLDARAAAIVMRTVRNTVDTGRTVVCTIHQPSIDIFESFDEMLLMKRGGRVVYMGPLGKNSELLIDYLQNIPGVPHCTPGYNPATWMLEATSAAVEAELGIDFAELYQQSALCTRNRDMVRHLSQPQRGTQDLVFPSQYSQSFWAQTKACLWKQRRTYWRSPDYNCVRYIFTLMTAILFGTMYWGVGNNISTTTSLFSVMGAMYSSVLFLGVNNSGNVQPVVAIERTIFYREKAAGMYSAIPYAIAQVLIEVPYCLAQVFLFSIVTYSMMSLQWTALKFFYYTFVLFFTLLYFTFYGMMAVAITPNLQVATILASGFYSIFNLFSGFMIFYPKMPAWVAWYYWACPVAWTVYGLIVTQFGDVKTLVEIAGSGAAVTVKDYVHNTFGMSAGMLAPVVAMPVVFTVIFAAVFVLGIKYLNFQQR